MRLAIGRYRSWLCGGSLGIVAFGLGWLLCLRVAPGGSALAQPPNRPAPAAAEPSEYSKRIVANIYGTIPITREELGEYLIARYGAEKLDLLINKRIIEHACAEKRITVTDAEIEADLDETTKGINVSRKDFIDKVLKARHLSMYEWKEDVVRPKLLLAKLARDRIQVENQEVVNAFESKHGEKVQCRIIHFPPGHPNIPPDFYQKIRGSDEEFDHAARTQPNANLAMAGGHVTPIGRHTTAPNVEKVIFGLKVNEVSEVISSENEGQLIVKCLGRVPPDTKVSIEQEREQLYKEVLEKRIQQEIPLVFRELRQTAQAKNWLSGRETQSDLVRDVQQELKSADDLGFNNPSGKRR